MHQETKNELPIRSFANEAAFEKWLDKQGEKSPGLWLRFFKKASGKKALEYKGALDVALMFGWIDSQTKKYDDVSYLQKFTPRGKKSVWSKINREHIARLTKEKRMRPGGLAAVEAAKLDGRWEGAYDSSKTMVMPKDFLLALSKNKKAHAFFKTLNKTNLYAIGWRLQTAKKQETREARMKKILLILADNQKFH